MHILLFSQYLFTIKCMIVSHSTTVFSVTFDVIGSCRREGSRFANVCKVSATTLIVSRTRQDTFSIMLIAVYKTMNYSNYGIQYNS